LVFSLLLTLKRFFPPIVWPAPPIVRVRRMAPLSPQTHRVAARAKIARAWRRL
jgi:hypothetical protein